MLKNTLGLALVIIIFVACEPEQNYTVKKTNPKSHQGSKGKKSGCNHAKGETCKGKEGSGNKSVNPIFGEVAEGSKPEFITPEGWERKEKSGMRYATLSKGSVEISVIQLRGMAGGILANVNRWRTQTGLLGITEDKLDACTKTINIGKHKATLVDLKGKTPADKALLGLILPYGEFAWFFKMPTTGKEAEASREAFLKVVNSIKFSEKKAVSKTKTNKTAEPKKTTEKSAGSHSKSSGSGTK
jgi:hypothetical protein